jgi:peptidyl-prolyl cis-trans isomerase D
VINQAGFFQSSDFRDYLRVEMTRRQLSQALIASEFSLPYQEEKTTSLQNQKRDIRFATINAEQFKTSVVVSEKEVENYYLENQIRFETAEKVKIDYLSLDVNELAKGITVSEAEVKAYYQENLANYRQAEQRRFAHILIEFGDDEAAAKIQAQAILTRINSGEDFATLAKTESSDTFSGENGGDLDWMERGTMDEAFDESAFALTDVNQVSELVKTDFGFHLIKMTDLKAEQLKTLVDLQDELKAKISNEKAQDEFFALQQEMARLSFEFPDSLDDAVTSIDGVTQTSTWLSRSGNSAPFDNSKLLDAVFSDLVLTEQVNSDVIEVTESLAMVIRLNEYQAAQVKPLTVVEMEIKSLLTAQKATEKAQTTADDILAEFTAGNDVTEALAAVNAAFETKADLARFGGQVDTNLSREAFVLAHPVEGTISAATIKLVNGDLAILEVQAVKAGESAVNPNLTQQQTSLLAQSAYQSYVETLRVDAKITRSVLTEPRAQY